MNDIVKYGTADLHPITGTDNTLRTISIDHTAPMHTHEFYELFLVIKGQALHLVNDSVVHISGGDLVLMRPDDRHCYDFYHSEDFEFINFAFSVDIIFAVSQVFLPLNPMENMLGDNLPPSAHLDKEDTNFIYNEISEAIRLIKAVSPEFSRNYFRGLFTFIVSKFFLAEVTNKNTAPPWLSLTVSQMQSIENFREGFPQMLKLAKCSEEHLCREFKRHYGTTPVKFINNLKLGYAMYLLTNTDMEIIDICENSGFNSLSHFYHLFTERFGKSPKKIRKEQNGI